VVSLLAADPANYESHPLHDDTREYPETNCYADILIELLHARGDDPHAVLGRAVRTDFEGDQWTFFKPDPRDVEALFGVDIHESQPYRSLPDHILEQISVGRTLIVELDSWYLPDTAATAYQREHVKSSAVMEAIDPDGRRLRYFHNRGLFELEGADYDGALRLGVEPGDDHLPPYAEIVTFDPERRLAGQALKDAAHAVFAYHFERRPQANPFSRFSAALEEDLPRLLEETHADYHAYAFATVRMAGAGFELCAAHVAWLFGPDGTEAADALMRIAVRAKALSFKLARRRPFDHAEIVETLAADWDDAMGNLGALVA
jgi:uncharacterized protein DUF1839